MADTGNGDESIGALIGRLIADAKSYARSEIAYYRTLAGERVSDAGWAALFGIGAVAIAQAVLVTLLVGAVFLLAPWLGFAVALIVVLLLGLAVTLILAAIAYGHARRAARAPTETPE